mgnify:CR=1 FL=1
MDQTSHHGVNGDEVLHVAATLPGTEQRPFGTSFGLRVAGKGFAYLSEETGTILLKATRQEQAALVASDPETFRPSHSSGQYGWVEVILSRVDPDEFRELLTEAWRLTAPRRLVAQHMITP